MELMAQNKYFDHKYYLNNKSIDFKTLMVFAVENKFLDEEYTEMIIESYENAIYDQIMATYDFDLEDDYELTLKELCSKYYLALNDYLRNLESPCTALSEVLKNSPKTLLCNAYDSFNYYKTNVDKKISILKEKNSLIIENNFEYKLFIKQISNYLNILKKNQLLYPTLNNKDLKDISSLKKLEQTLDDYIIESDILNKFDQRELLILLKKILYSEDYKGITSIAMYNYVFNYFFKDSTSILLTDNMCKIVIEGIQNNLYNINDIIEIIETGGIKYNNREKKYIIDNFVPAFQNEIINKKNCVPFIKIK